MKPLKILDLFSGIGGFSLAAHWAGGFETVAFVEKDTFCQKVLRKNFPGIPIYDDVKTFDGKQFRGTADIVCGGFPCQDVSTAGHKIGIDGERSQLWSEMCRIICEVRPRYAVVENVTGLLGRGFGRVLADLSACGFNAEWSVVSPCGMDAPHSRQRVFVIAYTNGNRFQGQFAQLQESEKWQSNLSQTFFSSEVKTGWNSIPAPYICRGGDGISNRVDRTRALGNAIVPQVAQPIFEAIREIESL